MGLTWIISSRILGDPGRQFKGISQCFWDCAHGSGRGSSLQVCGEGVFRGRVFSKFDKGWPLKLTVEGQQKMNRTAEAKQRKSVSRNVAEAKTCIAEAMRKISRKHEIMSIESNSNLDQYFFAFWSSASLLPNIQHGCIVETFVDIKQNEKVTVTVTNLFFFLKLWCALIFAWKKYCGILLKKKVNPSRFWFRYVLLCSTTGLSEQRSKPKGDQFLFSS